jgi:hypothetical protein
MSAQLLKKGTKARRKAQTAKAIATRLVRLRPAESGMLETGDSVQSAPNFPPAEEDPIAAVTQTTSVSSTQLSTGIAASILSDHEGESMSIAGSVAPPDGFEDSSSQRGEFDEAMVGVGVSEEEDSDAALSINDLGDLADSGELMDTGNSLGERINPDFATAPGDENLRASDTLSHDNY